MKEVNELRFPLVNMFWRVEDNSYLYEVILPPGGKRMAHLLLPDG